MNKTIARVIRDTGVYCAYENRAVTDRELEFFAQQIVRECAQFVGDPDSLAVLEMFEYFGVKPGNLQTSVKTL